MPTQIIPADAPVASDFSSILTSALSIALVLIVGLAWRRVSAWMTDVVEDVRMTKTQTTNNHDTNMRDDITSIAEKVDRVITCTDNMSQDQRQMRADLRTTLEHSMGVSRRMTEYESDTREVVAWARKQMGKEGK